jgi:hypothetical protein
MRPPPPTSSVSANAAWGPVITAAHRDASAGRSEDAERVLRDFSAAYPGTVEAAESNYWRAVFMLDPANSRSSPREAEMLLAEYLDSNASVAHRPEAIVLRRIASTLASAREATAREAAAARATAADSRDAEVRRLDSEVKRLKEELEKTTAELDRIKKRLSTPPAGPPPPGAPPPGTPPPPKPSPPIKPPR